MCPEDICTEKTETTHLTYKDQIRIIFLIFLSARTETENTEKGERDRN